ncbi:MAG: TM0106 family RecB-like putative nuclease [Cyanothece sp. SIO1E1]|nr:TM0106 family RecB-like putative nuclease [Cyanothece sp. SIO1E1]
MKSSKAEGWLTNHLLFHYQRCNRRAVLDFHGDAEQRDPPSDYLLKLQQDSSKHRQAVLAEKQFQQPSYPQGDWLTGASATLTLMQQGVEQIARGILITEGDAGFKLVSSPDLLVKQPGQSEFGDWLYVPTDIKLGRRPKQDYQMVAAFHAQVLAAVQGAWPESSWLILREGTTYEIDLEKRVPQMQMLMQACIQNLQSSHRPEVFIARSRCALCQWFSSCYQTAKADQHLSLLPGVTPARYSQLQTLGLTTMNALAIADAEKLAALPGFSRQTAYRLVNQAQATLQNRAIANLSEFNDFPFALSPVDLPTAPIELYFDIEAAPEQNLVYLHGVLVIDRQTQTETFHAFLAEKQADEQNIWEQFLNLVRQYPDAPIYHFCPYEVQTVKRLAVQYHAPMTQIEPLLDRFVDLHELVTKSAILPTESYALKHIARWIGFNWRDADANGAQSICWYDAWLTTCDRSFLDSILRYNEDDCRATYWVKNWLVEFARKFWRDEASQIQDNTAHSIENRI